MLLEILLSTLRMATPLAFAAMAGLLCERSGVVNIALEGLMLLGAFVAASTASYFHSAWAGWGLAGLAGMALAAMLAYLAINKKSDQVVVGMAINLFVFGFVPFLSKIIFNSTGSTPGLLLESRFTFEPMVMVVLVIALLFMFLRSTYLGLWLTFAGENPDSLVAHGISPNKVRWSSVLASGILAGWGGASLSVFLASSYSPQMSSGRGFMALAALILGRWQPWKVGLACLFFGLTDALQIRLQGSDIFGVILPVQWIQMLPYLVTVIALAGFLGSSRPPAALGK
jgi:ABC-type uncharacterized transport system permease subunit